jgi:hypothetical protein
MTSDDRPEIYISWANQRARRFCYELRRLLSEMFSHTNVVVATPDRDEIDSFRDLRFALLVLPFRSRGGDWLQYEAGLLEHKIGLDRVARLELSTWESWRASGPLQRVRSFDLSPGSMLRLLRGISESLEIPWSDRQLRFFLDNYSSLAEAFDGERYERSKKTESDHLRSLSNLFEQNSRVFSGPQGITGAMLGAIEEQDAGLEYLLERGAIATMESPSGLGAFGPVFLPVSIYVSGSDIDPSRISMLVEALANVFDMDIVAVLPPKYGSVLLRFWVRLRSLLGSEEARRLKKTLEYAARQATLENRQADIDLKKVQAMRELVETTKGFEKGVFRVGSMLVLKDGDNIAGYSMSAEEMIGIAEQPMVATDPDALAEWLRKPLFQQKVEAKVVQLAETKGEKTSGQVGLQQEPDRIALTSPLSTNQEEDGTDQSD